MADPYSILGLARGASEKDVKSAYRKLAKELHPDRNAGKPNATERFSQVTRAYDLLSDKDKRARFDRGEIDIDGNPAMPPGFGGYGGGSGRGGFEGMGGAGMGGGMGGGADGIDISEMFEGLFGGRAGAGMGAGMGGMGGQRTRAAPRGGNIQYRLAVSRQDAATRAPQRITLGDGKTIDLKLPAGVEDGTQMRLPGKGEAGPGGAGDAIVTIQLAPHAFYRREGDNLRVDLPITLDEAVNGAKVKVPTPDGAVMLTVAPGSSSGKTLRLGGKGFTRKDGTRGDLLVSLEIDLPAEDPAVLADLAQRLEGWHDARNPRARLGV